MRALVISDLHSNAEALRAVMSRMRRKRFDEIICLGDFVGYCAQPNQVLDALRKIRGRKRYVRGNHDRVAAGLEDGKGFNPLARQAAFWTRQHLSGPNRSFLRELPVGPVQYDGMMLCHGSPFDEDEYVFTEHQAAHVLTSHDARIIFYGHTHLPAIFHIDGDGFVWGTSVHGEGTFRLDPRSRYLINPGSVGQPRDRNPAASFAIYDSLKATVQFLRVPYDVSRTQAAIVRAGLPIVLAERLANGI